MDNAHSAGNERRTAHNVNGSARRPSTSPTSPTGTGNRPISLPDSPGPTGPYQILTVIVHRDENGYGMKVSGDNPVFVQSVKQGGAAEKAGLHAGDRIVEVNGENVLSSTHTEVVALIKSSTQVILKVQHKTGGTKMLGSSSLHTRLPTSHNPSRITGPQPVDNEKQFQLQLEREQHYRLMIEKEQRYLDLLRSQIAQAPDEKKIIELEKAERNLQKLLGMLQSHIKSNQPEQNVTPKEITETPPPLPSSPPPKILPPKLRSTRNYSNGNMPLEEIPPPLPKRNRSSMTPDTICNKNYVNGQEENDNRQHNEITNNKNLRTSTSENANLSDLANLRDRCSSLGSRGYGKCLFGPGTAAMVVDNAMYLGGTTTPPPLPPRVPLNPGIDSDGANSINKQMSYPLVATCATLVDNYPTNYTHQRTKSSPESLITLNPTEASRRLIASESMNDLSRNEAYEKAQTPPGTPPPPYPSPSAGRRYCINRNSSNTDEGDGSFEEINLSDVMSPDVSPLRNSTPSHHISGRVLANSSPIHAATPQISQQSIISMEDDEISEQDVSQLEDHGPFKSLSQLWHKDHMPYLAVFMNYVLSNSDINSLLFYLITDLYKEGNAKEMRKWAYEIHSCFLVPGAPLRISNVDESIAHEIDEVLQNEYDREEILRKIFWKARNKAKEELTKQLAEFQQKRVAGLGTIFGPPDCVLAEISRDKTGGKDVRLYETLLLERLEPYLEEIDRVNYDPRRYFTAASLTTVITRIFGVKPPGNVMDRCPTFVNKDKSLRTKLIGRYNRKLTSQGHQFIAQQYHTVIRCNNCHQIIFGISPQGYECSTCHINLHRTCINAFEDICPGPINKKGMLKIMDRIRHENKDQRRKHSSHFIQMEKERRLAEERDNGLDANESGEAKPGNPVTRTPSDRRPDAVREESSKTQDTHNQSHDHDNEGSNQESSVSLPASTGNKRRQHININRSESVKEQSEKNRKQRRNVSDPLHTTSETVDLDQQGPFRPNSVSSSNSSLSSRSLESPSSNADAVSDSDLEVEADPPDWKSNLTDEQLARLHPDEKKRQDVINELFHTERSHVRNLKVLDQIFRKTILENKALTDAELRLVFANLVELLAIHNQFNTVMKNKRKESPIVTEVGDILLNMFNGDMGNNFCNAAAKFCEKQQLALEFIKEKRKKDTKFETVLNNCEKNNHCRRLPLQGFIPQEMQRLSKYPLLLERLINSEEKKEREPTEGPHTELEKLMMALEKSKDILNRVNEAAKQAYNKARLEEIKNHLYSVDFERTDHCVVNEFKNFDLINYTLIHEGTVTLKRQNKNPLPVHMLLLEEAVIFLQREGERYVLKFFHVANQPLAPIIRMPNIICRKNAADDVTLFLVSNTQNSQMYELQCRDPSERKTWFKYLTDASETCKSRDSKGKKIDRIHDPEEESVQDISTSRPEPSDRAIDVTNTETDDFAATANTEISDRGNETPKEDKSVKSLPQPEIDMPVPPVYTAGDGVSIKLTANDWPLIQPSEVQVAFPPVHTAEPVLTPLEQIKRKDEEVKQALADKEVLVADLLSIPWEDYHLIADIASDEATKKSPTDYSDREPSELVLASVYQVSQLLSAVNNSLNISETEPVLAVGGKHPACASNESASKVCNHVPYGPVYRLQEIATTLNSQLTILLSVVKQREDEREKLRKEVHRLREQLHEKNDLHGHQPIDNDESAQYDSMQSGDLESIEESPTETETT